VRLAALVGFACVSHKSGYGPFTLMNPIQIFDAPPKIP
jgi:hypothetical protein